MNTSLYEFQDNWEIDMDGQYVSYHKMGLIYKNIM